MKISSILRNVGGAVISNVVPGGAAIVALVNGFLPENKKLPVTATGVEVQDALDTLPEADRADILSKELDYKLEDLKQVGETTRTMLVTEANATHTTRPKIALGSFYVVAAISLTVIGMWAYAVATQNAELLKVLVDGWALPLAVVAPFVELLRQYFGILRKEKADTLNASQGMATSAGGIISTIAGAFKK